MSARPTSYYKVDDEFNTYYAAGKLNPKAAERLADKLIKQFNIPLRKTRSLPTVNLEIPGFTPHVIYIADRARPPILALIGKEDFSYVILEGFITPDGNFHLLSDYELFRSTVVIVMFSIFAAVTLCREIPGIAMVSCRCPAFDDINGFQLNTYVSVLYEEGCVPAEDFRLDLMRDSDIVVTPDAWASYKNTILNKFNKLIEGVPIMTPEEALPVLHKLSQKYSIGIKEVKADKEKVEFWRGHIIFVPEYKFALRHAAIMLGYTEYGGGRCPSIKIETPHNPTIRYFPLYGEVYVLNQPHLLSIMLLADAVSGGTELYPDDLYLWRSAHKHEIIFYDRKVGRKKIVAVYNKGKSISPRKWNEFRRYVLARGIYDVL